MTEHKYTDEEVIEIRELIKKLDEDGRLWLESDYPCNACLPFEASNTIENLLTECIRQKAEVAFWMDAAANAKKEAVKEFAEKVKEYAEWYTDDNCSFDYIPLEDIDNAVKEFTEEKT